MLLRAYQTGKNIIRSIAASLLIGVIVGVIDAVFGRGLLAISDFRTEHFTYLIPFLPIAGLLIVWMYHHFSEISTKGMTLVLEMGQGKRKEIPMLLAPLVLVGTWITLEFIGGSLYRFLYFAFSGTCEVCRADSIRLKYVVALCAWSGNSFRCDLWIDRTIFCRIIKVCQRENESFFSKSICADRTGVNSSGDYFNPSLSGEIQWSWH